MMLAARHLAGRPRLHHALLYVERPHSLPTVQRFMETSNWPVSRLRVADTFKLALASSFVLQSKAPLRLLLDALTLYRSGETGLKDTLKMTLRMTQRASSSMRRGQGSVRVWMGVKKRSGKRRLGGYLSGARRGGRRRKKLWIRRWNSYRFGFRGYELSLSPHF